MTSIAASFHQNRVARLARIASKAKPDDHMVARPRHLFDEPTARRTILTSREIIRQHEESRAAARIEQQKEFERACLAVLAANPVTNIQRVVAAKFGVTTRDLNSARRTANVVRPRQIAMYLTKIQTSMSLPAIGRRFGGRDHTTVLHAVRKIEHLIARDAKLAALVDELKVGLSS